MVSQSHVRSWRPEKWQRASWKRVFGPHSKFSVPSLQPVQHQASAHISTLSILDKLLSILVCDRNLFPHLCEIWTPRGTIGLSGSRKFGQRDDALSLREVSKMRLLWLQTSCNHTVLSVQASRCQTSSVSMSRWICNALKVVCDVPISCRFVPKLLVLVFPWLFQEEIISQ